MRFALPFLLCLRAFGAMSTVQLAVNNNTTNCNSASGTTCVVTVTSTGSGHVLVFAIGFGGTTTDSLSSVSGGCSGSWVVPAGGQLSGVAGAVGSAYCLSSSSGATTVTGTINNSNQARGGLVYEIALDAGKTATFDVAGAVNDSSANTSQPGVALTLTGTDDLIIQVCSNTTGNISTISSPYTFDNGTAANTGPAHSYNTSSGTAPTWTLTGSAALRVTAVAITQATAATFVPTVSNFAIGP